MQNVFLVFLLRSKTITYFRTIEEPLLIQRLESISFFLPIFPNFMYFLRLVLLSFKCIRLSKCDCSAVAFSADKSEDSLRAPAIPCREESFHEQVVVVFAELLFGF